MKKLGIFLISILSIFLFAVLVYKGAKQRHGAPVVFEEKLPPVITSAFVDKKIDLKNGIDLAFWQTRPSQKISLTYQMMILPWPRENIPALKVKTFHNSEDIYFYLEWKDNTEDRMRQIKKFTDAAGIMFPLEKKHQKSTLLMGFMSKSNIWQWKAYYDSLLWRYPLKEEKVYADYHYPFENQELLGVSKEKIPSAVSDLVAKRPATITPRQHQAVSGRGIWKDGTWHVVLKRSLKGDNPKETVSFKRGNEYYIAFAVWDGSSGDKGGRKSISDWVKLKIK